MHSIETTTDVNDMMTTRCQCGWKHKITPYSVLHSNESFWSAISHLEDVIKENERVSRDYDDYY